MGKRIELQIQGSSNFAFDVEGEWLPSMEPEYRTGNPSDGTAPRLSSIREVWTISGCRIRSSDETIATLWDEFLAFRARIQSASAHPTYVRIVRDPDSAAVVELTLGPSGYEDLRFESIESELDPLSKASTWNTTASFTIVVSAVSKYADANGIVGWDQEVSLSYPNGCRVLEWRTRITTEEGTSAITKAQAYARIPVASLGDDHSYDTNGPDGIDYVAADADEQNSRVPTVVEAVSRIQQWGVSVGVTSGQGSPSDYDLTVVTRTTPDETEILTTAAATGPNAQAWVLSKKPQNATEVERVDGQAKKFYQVTWVKRKGNNATDPTKSDVYTVSITGGHRVQLWRTTTAGHPPHLSIGGFTAMRVTVGIKTMKSGDEDIDLPGLLGDPYILDANASEEGEAVIEGDRQPDPAQNKYSRSARLVYRTATRPTAKDATREILTLIRAATRVKSYYLR